jgi:hypothetical protein
MVPQPSRRGTIPTRMARHRRGERGRAIWQTGSRFREQPAQEFALWSGWLEDHHECGNEDEPDDQHSQRDRIVLKQTPILIEMHDGPYATLLSRPDGRGGGLKSLVALVGQEVQVRWPKFIKRGGRDDFRARPIPPQDGGTRAE